MAGIEVRIGADTSELEGAVKRSKSQLRQLSDEMKMGIGQAAKYGAAAVAAGAALAAGLTVKGLAAVDAQAKLAKQLGTTSKSMATLERAGQLSGIGIEKINASATRLTRRLSLAEAGSGPAADAIERLGLNAAEVAALPLDERINKVNTAISTMIPAAEQAGVATQLFGEEAGIAMRSLDPAVMSQARKEAELFGTAISDFDASQVEAANDAISTIGTAVDGVTKQLAIQMAPIIKAVGDLFVDVAKEAGGVGEATSEAFGFIVESTAQVINAVDGIKRVFTVVADGIIVVWNSMASRITGVFQSVLESISNDFVPGMDFSQTIKSLEDFSAEAGSIADMAGQNIQETLMGQMAGDKFKEFVASQKEAAAKAKEEFRAEGLTVPDIIYGTDEENQEKIEREKERQEEENEAQLERRKKFAERMQALEYGANERMADMDEKNKRLREKGEKDFWRNSTSLMNSGSRKMFEIGKAASLSQAVVKGFSAATSAWDAGMATGGPAAPVIAAAYTAASLARTGAQISAIKSASFGGGSGGGAGGGGSVTGNINAQNQPVETQRSTNIDISLIGADSRDRAVGGSIIAQINEEIERGERINRIALA